jgi:hypothetical protein
MKNQEVRITPFQGFLATLSGAAPRRFQRHVLANELLTSKSLFQRALSPPNGLRVNFPAFAPGGPP